VTLINTEGMALIGPGSEWFWTALSGVVLALTFLAIYRQLRLQRSANAFEQLNGLVDAWESERMLRQRLAAYLALRDGGALSEIPAGAAFYIADFWEKVGGLTRAGHIETSLIKESLGLACQSWWWILTPIVQEERAGSDDPTAYIHFEWTAAKMATMGPTRSFDRATIDRVLEERIASTQASLHDLEEMRR